jgi:hypothetical protein
MEIAQPPRREPRRLYADLGRLDKTPRRALDPEAVPYFLRKACMR